MGQSGGKVGQGGAGWDRGWDWSSGVGRVGEVGWGGEGWGGVDRPYEQKNDGITPHCNILSSAAVQRIIVVHISLLLDVIVHEAVAAESLKKSSRSARNQKKCEPQSEWDGASQRHACRDAQGRSRVESDVEELLQEGDGNDGRQERQRPHPADEQSAVIAAVARAWEEDVTAQRVGPAAQVHTNVSVSAL